MVLSSVLLGALSDRQIRLVLRHAADQTTLLPRIAELDPDRPALPLRTRAQARLDLEARRRLPFTTKQEFLKKTGCDHYKR